jgi:hypothetical protein
MRYKLLGSVLEIHPAEPSTGFFCLLSETLHATHGLVSGNEPRYTTLDNLKVTGKIMMFDVTTFDFSHSSRSIKFV